MNKAEMLLEACEEFYDIIVQDDFDPDVLHSDPEHWFHSRFGLCINILACLNNRYSLNIAYSHIHKQLEYLIDSWCSERRYSTSNKFPLLIDSDMWRDEYLADRIDLLGHMIIELEEIGYV